LDHQLERTERRARWDQTGKVGRRNWTAGKRRAFLVALLALASACTPKPAALYLAAKALYKEGRFSEASQKAEEGYSSFKSQTQSEWHWKFALLAAELQLLGANTGRADVFLAAGPPAKFAGFIPRHEMLRGYSLYRRNRYAESQEFLKLAISGARSSGDHETETDAWLYLGTARMTHGDLMAADLDFRRAQELAEANHLEYQSAAALVDRGLIQIKRERYGDAIPLLEAARELANRTGVRPISAFALANLANCHESLGNLDQALATLLASVEEQKRFGLATSLSNNYSELGVIHLRKGDMTEALRDFHQAFEAVNKDAPVQRTLAAENLAKALDQTGALDEAERFNQIAFNSVNPENKPTIASLTLTRAAISEHRGQHDEATAIYQKAIDIGSGTPSVLWQAYAGLAAVYSAKGDFLDADANYATALSVISSNRADQLKSDYKITFLSNLMRFYQDYVALLIHHGDSNRALEIADSSRASVLTEDLLGQSIPSRRALLPQIQKAAKASRSVFLFYWLAPKTSYLWAITGTQTKAVPLPDQRQITQDAESYRALIEQGKRDPLAMSSQAGARLYRELVAPVADFIPSGSRVVIVPDGPLHNLNFETLLVSTPQPHYWIDDVTVSVAPSLGVLRAGKSAIPGRRSLLLIGDPVTQGSGYPPLPQAALEMANIQRQFPATGSTALTGPNAVVDAYAAAQPQKFSTIHFATHVDANAQSPLDSAIILSPRPNGFKLYARDVAGIPLNADLVTISACRGAGARTLSGEGLVGFAWAFFQARAQNVVTSLWDVYDNSTAQLMDDFYAGVKGGRSYAAALREAKLKMLHTNYKRPYYWAPFQLYSRTP
jgi:CHAT domain-containing protein/Flp pilus assembly protein TadD